MKYYHFASDRYAIRAPLKPEVTLTVQLLSQLDKNRYPIPITEDDHVGRKMDAVLCLKLKIYMLSDIKAIRSAYFFSFRRF